LGWETEAEKSWDEFNNPDWQRRLEALPGWSWAPGTDRVETQWEKGVFHVKHFLEQHGHSQIPFHYKTDDGFRLGRWVQRQPIPQNAVDPDRKARLEALPWWSWSSPDRLEAIWEERFVKLKQSSEREGHSRVPYQHKTDDNFRLGQWVSSQRMKFTNDKLDPYRRRRLEALPGWVWKIEQ
jgi:Helicase associated domain